MNPVLGDLHDARRDVPECAATVLPLAFTESMATRAASRRVWTCDSRSERRRD
jgi:hypothetical protein